MRTALRALVLAAAALAAAASSNQAPAARPSGKLTQLTTTGAGSALSRLTGDPTDEVGPAISPDGTILLFTVQTFDRRTGYLAQSVIVGMNPQASGSRQFYTGNTALATLPAWSPDGSLIVFGSTAMGSWNLVRTLAGTPNAALSLVVRNDIAPEPGRPSLSPDGKMVAYHTRMQGLWNIATSTMDGAQMTLLGEGLDPSWSPDGGRIAFARRVNGVFQIFTVDAKTGTGLAQITTVQGDAIRPTWSPDGKWLAFAAAVGRQRGASNLFAIHPDGTGLTQLTDGASVVNSPAWSNDGWLYFSASQGPSFDIWRLKPVL
jgi:TolB protein